MRLFLIGHPVAHSISPQMHNAALVALGIPPSYALLDTPPDQLAGAMARLREADALGCNVTVPHKQAVVPFLDQLSDSAARVGAVNTILHEDRRLIGHNTDGAGFLAALEEEGVDLRGRRVLLLGAGGAARAIAYAVAAGGAASLVILNRDRQRALDLATAVQRDLGAAPAAPQGGAASPPALGPAASRIAGDGLGRVTLARLLRECDLVVNATTVGLHGEPSLVPAELIPSGIVVCDIIYNPPETALLVAARAAGARGINGLGMLVHQAAAALSIWLQRPAPVDVMYRAATDALEHLRGQA